MFKRVRNHEGFTLIEVLLVVAIIAILAGIVILAINPGKQLADTRNATRKADVNTILNAVEQYAIDNQGNLPAGITTGTKDICATGIDPTTCSNDNLLNLSVLTAGEKYLTAIPMDPQQTPGSADTRYSISEDNNGRVTVTAVDAENETISATE
jgi:type IV pilus assembly protein PilA